MRWLPKLWATLNISSTKSKLVTLHSSVQMNVQKEWRTRPYVHHSTLSKLSDITWSLSALNRATTVSIANAKWRGSTSINIMMNRSALRIWPRSTLNSIKKTLHYSNPRRIWTSNTNKLMQTSNFFSNKKVNEIRDINFQINNLILLSFSENIFSVSFQNFESSIKFIIYIIEIALLLLISINSRNVIKHFYWKLII